jgi:hypothetical protein
MTENEQIEEMAKIIDDTQCIGMTIKACRAETRLGNSCGMCKAKRLHSKGYRKASDVAWAIFDNVDEIAYRYLNDADYSAGDMIYDLNELKKKYTEGEQ